MCSILLQLPHTDVKNPKCPFKETKDANCLHGWPAIIELCHKTPPSGMPTTLVIVSSAEIVGCHHWAGDPRCVQLAGMHLFSSLNQRKEEKERETNKLVAGVQMGQFSKLLLNFSQLKIEFVWVNFPSICITPSFPFVVVGCPSYWAKTAFPLFVWGLPMLLLHQRISRVCLARYF